MGKEKKEIGKLIELLNEYNCKVLRHTDKWKEKSGRLTMEIDYNHSRSYNTDLYIISLRYGFIKWLVENDKIDIVKVYKNLNDYEIEIRIRAVKELLEDNEEDTIAYLKLLMILSIQDEPIRFLCEIIK